MPKFNKEVPLKQLPGTPGHVTGVIGVRFARRRAPRQVYVDEDNGRKTVHTDKSTDLENRGPYVPNTPASAALLLWLQNAGVPDQYRPYIAAVFMSLPTSTSSEVEKIVRSMLIPLLPPEASIDFLSAATQIKALVTNNTSIPSRDASAAGDVPSTVRHHRKFGNGGGETVWWFSQGPNNLEAPISINANIADIQQHKNNRTGRIQTWVLTHNGWEQVTDDPSRYHFDHPILLDRVLTIRGDGTPNWILRSSMTTQTTRNRRNT